MKKMKQDVSVFWFRRDLRLEDNAGLFQALQSEWPVLPLFIFDSEILDELNEKRDARVEFILGAINRIQTELVSVGSAILVKIGKPIEVWEQLSDQFNIRAVFTNNDYEPYAIRRDESLRQWLKNKNINFDSVKDQVVFEKSEVVKDDGSPYTVFTPFSKKWKSLFTSEKVKAFPSESRQKNFLKMKATPIPLLGELGFFPSNIEFPAINPHEEIIVHYERDRNFPGIEGTTKMGLHLRFGTVSIRKMVSLAVRLNETWLNELIWREFFMMILWHFPHVVLGPFKKAYANINWRNDESEFKLWCEGKTGYPMVDAGMRELNQTGFMHNRVRMVVAGFLTKHLLIDWQWGEAYFASKLLDFDLSANNGNWQWAAGTGCDSAPYFRIFNPSEQFKKFDPAAVYVKKWVPEYGTDAYPEPMVDHKMARERCLLAYKNALTKFSS